MLLKLSTFLGRLKFDSLKRFSRYGIKFFFRENGPICDLAEALKITSYTFYNILQKSEDEVQKYFGFHKIYFRQIFFCIWPGSVRN